MWRCELCDGYLRILQTGYLCDTCYKIRLITKCYSNEDILKCVEKNFKVKGEEVFEKPKAYKNVSVSELQNVVLKKSISLPKLVEEVSIANEDNKYEEISNAVVNKRIERNNKRK